MVLLNPLRAFIPIEDMEDEDDEPEDIYQWLSEFEC